MMKEANETVTLFSEQANQLEKIHVELQRKFTLLKQKLEDSHQTLEKIIDHMSDGLIFVTFAGNITLFNPTAENLTGFTQKEVLNTSFWDHFPDCLFGFSMKKALSSPLSYHHVFLTMNGVKEIEVSTSYIPEKGIVLLLRDRTEIQQLEKNLAHNQRLKELGEMAATLAHEIRNPLGGIEGFSRLLLRDIQDEKQQEMIENVLEGARALNRLVTNVLEYSRELDLHFSKINLGELVEDVISLVSLDPAACPIYLKKNGEAVFVLADNDSLKRALINLFKNAFEAFAKQIHVTIAEDALKICDNGVGIPQENRDKIFTPFFTTKAQGTGLGLAEVYKIIQAHGGQVTVESNQAGTVFTIKMRRNYAG